MPEGPEIRRAADAIAEVLEGQTLQTVRFGQPRLRRWGKKLTGLKVEKVETRGKAMLTHLDNGHSIYSHNQLYGVWRVVAGRTLPQTNRSQRLLLQTENHSAILYSASDISVMPTGELDQHPFLSKLGPDIMASDLDWPRIAGRLNDSTFTGKTLAALYLDQGFLAGVGNYLRSEILHDARLHPLRKPSSLSRGETGRLARSTLGISQRSYRTKGVTLTRQLAGSLEKSGLDWEKRRFYAYGREECPCYHCGHRIVRTEANSRGLYYCPECQTAG